MCVCLCVFCFLLVILVQYSNSSSYRDSKASKTINLKVASEQTSGRERKKCLTERRLNEVNISCKWTLTPESNRIVFAFLSRSLSSLFPSRGNATTKNNRNINARKKESSSGQSKREEEEEEEDGREKTNRLHFYAIEFEPLTSQLVITVGEFQNDGTHTHTSIFQTEPNQKEGKKKLCHRTTSIHYSIYLSALLFACSLFFGILLGKKVGWEREANTEKH